MKPHRSSILAGTALLVIYLQIALAAIQKSQLGIDFNMQLLESQDVLVFGSIVQINSPFAGKSDGNIVHLAKVAFRAMEAAHDQYMVKVSRGELSTEDRPQAKPGVLTVLTVGNTAYLATSSKGTNSLFYYVETVKVTNAQNREFERPKYALTIPAEADTLRGYIVDGLTKCAAATLQVNQGILGHRTGAGCGEFMALLAYEQQNGNRPPTEARIVTVGRNGRDRDPEDSRFKSLTIAEPCNGGSKGLSSFGCTQFLDWEGWRHQIRVINHETQEEDWSMDDGDLTITPLIFP